MSFDAAEKYQSQIPAIQALVALGFRPISQADTDKRRVRLRNVVLDDVLVQQLLTINKFNHRGRDYPFDLQDAHEAIRRLKPTPDKIKGLKGTNQDIYDTARTRHDDCQDHRRRQQELFLSFHRLGAAREQCLPRDCGDFRRAHRQLQTKRCDIVGFVNGIPFVVVENKRPTESLKKAGSQLIGYQSEDNIPHLFHFAQMLMTMNRAGGALRYGRNAAEVLADLARRRGHGRRHRRPFDQIAP